MTANRPRLLLLFLLLGNCLPLAAQQSEADSTLLAGLRAKAEKGDAQAQFDLGVAFSLGNLGVAEDHYEAVKWYRKAAEQSCADAQNDLGVCYAKGQGVAKDEVEAARYRKAAEQNHSQAQFNLGVCYGLGEGVAKDDAEAIKWYRKAADQNYAEAQNSLGFCYDKGKGVVKDNVEAVKWYRKAAEQNNAPGQYDLGVCYDNGKGVAKDEVEAVRWFCKAAEQNLARAQNNLGVRYELGEGVTKDYVEGYKWYLLAAGQGDEVARTNSIILENRMTREQIAEGQKLARNFKPHVVSSVGDSSAGAIAETRPQASGTGFFITEDGYFITNEHVVANGAQVKLVTSAGMLSAKVMKVDAANDLALLKAEGRFAALLVASSRAVRVGSTVATVGFPNIGLQGIAAKLTKGEISSLTGPQDDPRYFQISTPVQPGNSGGALIDDRGNVVGVVSAKLDASAALAASGALPENVNYAIKSSFLLGFLESVPEVSAKLKEPISVEPKFDEVVQSAQAAAVLVLVH